MRRFIVIAGVIAAFVYLLRWFYRQDRQDTVIDGGRNPWPFELRDVSPERIHKCSCGEELTPFIQDMADGPTGLSPFPIYTEFSRFWESPDWDQSVADESDRQYIAEREREFERSGVYAESANDAMDAIISHIPTVHDVLLTDGARYSEGTHVTGRDARRRLESKRDMGIEDEFAIQMGEDLERDDRRQTT